MHTSANGYPSWLISCALALLSYFYFPGHTWLQQDSQIYAAILEHQENPGILRNDPIATEPHTAYTVYNRAALAVRKTTGLDFHTILAAGQIAARALGIWGLWLIATANGLSFGGAWLVAMAVGLGASIKGPEVLTFEYEPTPRAIAVPLLFCALGLASHRRTVAAAVAGAAAFLFHPPAALPFWGMFLWLERRRKIVYAVLLAAVGLLALSGRGAQQPFFGTVGAFDEQMLRLRAAYVWISAWPPAFILHHLIIGLVLVVAWLRVRGNGLLLGMAAVGLASMPVSWLLLDAAKWRGVVELQPMRWLLWTTAAMQLLAGVAAVGAAKERRLPEAFAWFVAAFILPLQPVITRDFSWRHWAVALALAAAALFATRAKLAPLAGLASFFAVPILGGVVNYPRLHTPQLAQLAEWARTSTPRDAVFQFAQGGHSVEPGIFRSEAQRAVYVEWKGGGQMVYLPQFESEWWFRWQQTRSVNLARFGAMGIRYVVMKQNGDYQVFDTQTGMPARQSR